MLVIDDKKPIYVQIYEHIKNMILNKKYIEHQKLPSKRMLAQSLKVSPMTIDVAYQQLMAEGYIYSKPKSGYYVEKQIEMIKPIKHVTVSKPTQSVFLKQYLYSFKTNVVDTSIFPYSTWSKLTKAVLLDYALNLLNESDPQGLYELRLEIAKYLELYRGMSVEVNQIVIGSGSTSLISMIVELLGRKKHYAIENPGYHKIYQLFRGQDVKLSLINLDESGIDINSVHEKNPDILHITPSHQFPSGIVMPIKRRLELLNWANEQDHFIIEDDYDSEFRYTGKPIPALQGLNPDKVIYMNTFTKTLAPSLRVNYMVLPKPLLNPYLSLNSYHSCTVPLLEQYVLYLFMKQGSFIRHLNKMKLRYKQKVDIILSKLSDIDFVKPLYFDAGLHGILDIQNPKIKKACLDAFENAKIYIKPMDAFYFFDDEVKSFQLVLGYAGIELKALDKAMDVLIETIKKTL